MDLYLGKLITIFFRIGGYFGLALLSITIINSIFGSPESETAKITKKIRSMDYKHGNIKPNEFDTNRKLPENTCSKFEKSEAREIIVKTEPDVEWEEKWVRHNGRLRKMVVVY
jgi:hypothetical protein